MSQDRQFDQGGSQQPAPGFSPGGTQPEYVTADSGRAPVRVIHGAFDQPFDKLQGQTVGFVKKTLRDAANIPSDAEALIGGKQVGDDYVLNSGQTLEFVKEAGVKG